MFVQGLGIFTAVLALAFTALMIHLRKGKGTHWIRSRPERLNIISWFIAENLVVCGKG